jgi:hypothetical protein
MCAERRGDGRTDSLGTSSRAHRQQLTARELTTIAEGKHLVTAMLQQFDTCSTGFSAACATWQPTSPTMKAFPPGIGASA